MADHKDLVAAASHVIGYVQAASPGAIGASKVWVENDLGDRNFMIRLRNAGDAAWADVVPPYLYTFTNTTTDATPTELFLDGAAVRLSVPNDTTMFFEIFVAARRTDVDNESAGYVFRGVIDNNAGTTALVGAVSAVYTNEDTGAWAVAVTADNVNDALVITVTGEVAKTIDWKAIAMIVEVTG